MTSHKQPRLAGEGVSRRALLGAAGAGSLSLAGAPAYAVADPVPAVVEGVVLNGGAPGAVAAVSRADAAPQYYRAGRISFDSRRLADENTLWRIYSMTKPVTGMAAMLLVAEGKLGLDQPIAELLPAFRDMRVLTDPNNSLATRPAERPITVRHLLTHTAGLGYAHVTKGPLRDEYLRLGLTPGARRRPGAEGDMPELDLKTFADRLATVPLIAEPGTMWSYSVGLDLLGRVIEVASRMEFAEFLRQRFFVPLGMDDTDFYVPAEKVSRLAACYRRQDGKLVLSDPGPGSSYLTPPPMPSGGGGLVSSARDYHRFLQAIANGGVFAGRAIMPLEAVRIGTSNLLPPHTDMRAFLAPPGSDGFGAGGSVTSTGANAGAFGWGGAAGTIALANPRTRLAVSGYINVMDDFSFAQELPRAVFAGA